MDRFKEGLKFDQGKDPWHLAPWDAFRAIIKVLDFGAKKYDPRNWEKGMAWSRPYGALIRHLTAWWEGEAQDPETGFSHLWHAGCCIIFLIAYEIRGVGTDDRPVKANVLGGGGDGGGNRVLGSLSGTVIDFPAPGDRSESPAESDSGGDIHGYFGC